MMPNVGSVVSHPPSRSINVDGKKFLWNGCFFDSHEEASRQAEIYKNDNFEVYLVQHEEKFIVYSRKAIKEAVTAL
jgi:hypothetical protein